MRRGALLMMFSALAFSGMTVFVKLAGQRIPSQELVVARAAISLGLTGWMLSHAGVSPWGQQKGWLWLRGLRLRRGHPPTSRRSHRTSIPAPADHGRARGPLSG